MMTPVPCIGCGAMFPTSAGAVHRYMESSPGCWAAFGEVVAREYSNIAYARAHRLTVDTYAVQHPGQPSPQSIQSVGLHLISLCLVLQYSVSMERATEVLQESARFKRRLVWLDPPPTRGNITVADVHAAKDAQEHVQLVRAWADSAWAAWVAHHQTIEEWLQQFAPSQGRAV
jgi:hypothetical protein